MTAKPRVAIVRDWMVADAGSERVEGWGFRGLSHQQLVYVLRGLGGLTLIAVAIPVMVLSGAISWQFIERPISRWTAASRAPWSPLRLTQPSMAE
jgi:peptidoglycan/LPS O-acetylase OafA/YrhL